MRSHLPAIAETPPQFSAYDVGMAPGVSADATMRGRTNAARPRIGRNARTPQLGQSGRHTPIDERVKACAALDAMWAARPLAPPSRKPPITHAATAGERALLHDIRLGVWEP